ncbi:MAG: hypothetical protein K0S07_406 [Chlamydiales bacterium]|jgi:tRNA/tmRNA/rRNA uracil-C5-methylase (TrmA/RlmC/RlmD family)|nr:hypothetical protein [Chlamydiales bacterium]
MQFHCRHFQRCSGCTLVENLLEPPLLLEVREFFQERGIALPSVEGLQATQWRSRAKVAVRQQEGAIQIGLFEKGSHRVMSIPDCQAHHPQINAAIRHIQDWMQEHALSAYDEKTFQGILRYIQLTVEPKSDLVQLVFVLNLKEAGYLAEQLKTLPGEIWHSIWLNYNTARTNAIFGADWHLVKGDPFLTAQLSLKGSPSLDFLLHPASFVQANWPVFEKLVQDLKGQIRLKSRLLELYAGIGIMGIAFADQMEQVDLVEINPFSAISFEEWKKRYGCPSHVTHHEKDSREALAFIEGAEVILVDPPRKGLEKSVVEALNGAASAKQLIYVSCHFASFKRDCQLLELNWKVSYAKAYLFFPGTDHLEILATFERR